MVTHAVSAPSDRDAFSYYSCRIIIALQGGGGGMFFLPKSRLIIDSSIDHRNTSMLHRQMSSQFPTTAWTQAMAHCLSSLTDK